MLKKYYKNDSKPLGNEGENIANDFLIKKGYKILERNFRFSKGESKGNNKSHRYRSWFKHSIKV